MKRKLLGGVLLGMMIPLCKGVYADASLQNVVDQLTTMNNKISSVETKVGVVGNFVNTLFVRNNSTGSYTNFINELMFNFYDWYTRTTNLIPLDLGNNSSKVGELLAKESYYILVTDKNKKALNSKALLVAPAEGKANDFDAEALDPSFKKGSNLIAFPRAELSNADYQSSSLPTISDLLEFNGDVPGGASNSRAKVFINYLLESSPGPDNFTLPAAAPSSTDTIKLCPPGGSADDCKQIVDRRITVKDSNGNETTDTEYKAMLSYFKSHPTFQKYKLHSRIATVLRSIYLEPVFRAYQDRVKPATDKKSLAEMEYTYATEGMSKDYYEKLKNSSVAEVNLEVLRTINKLVYFTYRLNQSGEYLKIVGSLTALSLNKMVGAADEITYNRVISELIKNECWKGDNRNGDACKNAGSISPLKQ